MSLEERFWVHWKRLHPSPKTPPPPPPIDPSDAVHLACEKWAVRLDN